VVAESFLPQINGVTNSVCRVLDHLASQGHEAAVVAPTGPPTYAGFPVFPVRGVRLPFYRDFRVGMESRTRLSLVMEIFRPDVVHVASPATLGYQAVRAAIDLGTPTVAIYQTDLIGFAERYGLPRARWAAEGLVRSIHASTNLTLAPSTASVRQLLELGIDRVALWPRGVDLVQFHPQHRSETLRRALSPDGRPLVGYVGRLAPEKELDLLVGLARRDDLQLVVVGDGPDRARLGRLLPEAAFLGLLRGADLSAAYASLDVFVHTGRHETYCQSAQEALASGVPAVAPRAGGPLDVIAEGVDGLFYEPGSAADLTAAVMSLVDDPSRRHEMGSNARRAVLGRSWESVNDRLLASYRAVIDDDRMMIAA